MQSASFLEGQRQLQEIKGKSNVGTVFQFQMERIPTDIHIRNLLNRVSPAELREEYRYLLAEMWEEVNRR